MQRWCVLSNFVKKPARFVVTSAVKRYPQQAVKLAKFINAKAGVKPAERVIQVTGKSKSKGTGTLAALPSQASHSDIMTAIYGAGALSEGDAHKWLTTLFSERRLVEFEDILRHPIEEYSYLWLYHQIRLFHYRGTPYRDNKALAELELITTNKPYLHKAVRNLAVHEFCLSGDIDALRRHVLTPSKGIADLTRVSVMGSLRLLMRHGHMNEAAGILSEYLADADNELRLYFIEPLLALRDMVQGNFYVPSDWRETNAIFKMVFSSKDEVSHREFTDLYAGPLDNIPQSHDFMDVRINEQQRTQLTNHIADALRAKKPLSLIRLGDGEAYAFTAPTMASAPPEAFDRDNEVRELHWWGRIPPEDVRSKIKSAAREAIGKADILGVPSVYRLIRDRGARGSGIGGDRSKRGLVTALNGTWQELPATNRLYTEERCHQVIFDQATIERLASTADGVVIVGCWSEEQLDTNKIRNASFIKIPAHTKVREDATEQPLYEVYEEICSEISAQSAPGRLVLVGAGLIGKIFIATARENGAVALDVGSVLDYMAGRKTRSVTDMV